MYKNKSGELVFKNKEEYQEFSEKCKNSTRPIKTTGLRIHVDRDFDIVYQKR